MKKVFKISLLSRFLLVLGLIITLFLCVQINHAYSTQIKYSANNIPIKRPLNLFKFEESADSSNLKRFNGRLIGILFALYFICVE